MDYQVFLVSRIREEWRAGAISDSDAVASGLARTGRIITSAAAIMICVFAAFVLGDLRVASSGADITVVPRFVSAVASMQRPVTVMLDHAEAVTNKQCLKTIAEFALRLPPGWQFVLASRAGVPLPTARLRAQGGLVEVGAEDLTMGPLEASSLLKGAGADVDEVSIHDLLQRTEGWPAGLYIAALAMNAGSRQSEVGFTFTGDDVFMGDYLRFELLDRVSTAEASFLIRTSVLDRMCGPLCDAILGSRGSGRVLERMEDQNLLVVPLDRRREWYRYHHLFRDLLRSELRRQEPDLVQDFHFPGGSTMEGTLAYMRACLCRDGIGEMRRDAQIAWDGLSPASPYRATMLYTQGISYLLEDDPDRADPILARAFEDSTSAGALPLAAMILAEQCDVAAHRDDWSEVTALAERAVTIVETGRFGDYWTRCAPFARQAGWLDAFSEPEQGRSPKLAPCISASSPSWSASMTRLSASSWTCWASSWWRTPPL